MMDIDAEANRILARMRQCQTAEELEAVANEERDTVKAMANERDSGARIRHIVRAKQHMLEGFGNETTKFEG